MNLIACAALAALLYALLALVERYTVPALAPRIGEDAAAWVVLAIHVVVFAVVAGVLIRVLA